jgi:molybdenum cofactor synthesis domain-containing protein
VSNGSNVPYRTAVLVFSDRAMADKRVDACLPIAREMLAGRFVVEVERVLPKESAALQALLIDLSDRVGIALVFTSGGTGLGPRDRAPQATAAILDYEVPGIAEAMRAASLRITPTAMLSRAVAGVRGRTLIVNLPPSPNAVRETLAVLLPVLPDALDVLAR